VRTDTRAEIGEVEEKGSGTETAALQDATQGEMMMTGPREEIGTYSMTEEVEVGGVVIGVIAMDSEEGQDETARRAHLPHRRRRNQPPT